ncbi:hypothetical protein [uncultured Planktosalinus sp.]|uniref:hypothetical protein n=1 Tax=uncultured Planktosalinus sp. TaxID=1810935 RepID=UPI0030DD9F85
MLKEKLIDYFEKLEKNNFFIDDKLTSTKLHKYLLPIIQFLIRKEQFVANGDLHLITFMGAVIDGILYFVMPDYYYPIFIALFFILGIYRRREVKKNGKYVDMFW